MIKDELNIQLKNFINRLKRYWQIFFALSLIIYGVSLYHFFRNLSVSGMGAGTGKFIHTLDNLSFAIAIILAFLIFHLKRKYFSGKKSRELIINLLKKDQQPSGQDILKHVFSNLERKLYLIWFMGFLIVLDGVVLYWITHLDRNMHIYFVIGSFSLLLNYPRKVLFEDLLWQVRQTKKEFSEKAGDE
ncbi:MAG: hypothetical protein ACE5GL_07970 [Calditrichia bacterium]